MHIKLTHQNAARGKQRQTATRLHFLPNFQLTGLSRKVQNHLTPSSESNALWGMACLRFLLLGCFVASFFNATAGYIPVQLTGFNVDAVCNGAGTAPATTSGLGVTANGPSGFDNSGYWLMDSTFNPGLGTPTGGAMPPSLNISSAITPGLSWTLQSYNSNNALRIGSATTVTTDSLLFPTGTSAISAGELYMLYTNVQFTVGDSVFVTVNFTDGSTQVPIAKALPNWFSTSGFTPARAIGGRYNGNSNVWDNQGTAAGPMLYQHQIDILPANYAKKIRSVVFTHKLANNFLYVFGITVNPPCTGKPSAGAVKPVSACPNVNFTLQLDGASQASNLSYLWQQSPNGTVWTNVAPGSTQPTVNYNINTPTYFRCVVTCNNSNLSDTSAPYLASIAPFYQCYCASTSTPTSSSIYGNVGNFTIKTQPANVTVLNNGNASPLTYNTTATRHYTNFTNVAPAVMYRDSAYKFIVTEISNTYFATGTNIAAVYLDFNRDGVYDPFERILYQNIGANTTTQQATGVFTIPDTAYYGLTGMRVIVYPFAGTLNPCGTYSYGETEDYLADLRLPPCDGPSNPGVAIASAASMCAGYNILLTDTTYEKQRSSLSRIWQKSTDFGGTWTNIAGGNDKDTMSVLFTGATSYRLKMVCTMTGDSTFSNIINVALKPAYKCYCYSMATGGANDTTDIGGFTIRNFVAADNGPHVLNPKAIKGRTDYTDLGPLELFIDSTYKVEMYQSMSGAKHADARVTMFIDYNNNMQYDIPAERITLSNDVTNLTNWYLNNTFTVPSAAVRNVPTGMRIIINNDLTPNTPSDEACGAYTSGETEDFVVVIRKGLSSTRVNNISNLQNLQLYPNPTNGRFIVSFNADKAVKDLNVIVTNITGQRIYHEAHNNIGVSFSKEIDLSKEARGVYFVTITADGEKTVRMVTVQ